MLKKILSLFSILIAISVITFALIKLSPGDPATNYLRVAHIAITDESLRVTRERFGLDKPYIIQYLNWLGNIFKGDFGKSYITNKPVFEMIKIAIIPTFELGIFSLVILVIISPILGVLSAIYKNTWIDKIVQFFSYVGVSLPTFWIGYVLIIVFATVFKILPVSGRGDFKNYILPSVTIIIPLIAQTTFFIRKNILLEMEKPHVEYALIRGVSRFKVVKNHLLRNCLVPILTVFSSNVMYVLSGSVLIEEIFAWPGIGKLFTTAVKNGDLPLIQIQLLFFGILSIIVNEITQIVVKQINPKTKIIENNKNKIMKEKK